jgi:urease accessory protein
MRLGLLLLADNRFPAGAHAHSGGVEAAVTDGRVHDAPTLEAFVYGRVCSVGLTDAALTAATVNAIGSTTHDQWPDMLRALDREAHCRIIAAPLRDASRRLGRQMVRAGASCWPDSALLAVFEIFPDGIHQSVALGVTALAAGLTVLESAQMSLYHAITLSASAGVRLLGLDPFAVAAMTARFEALVDELSATATQAAVGSLADLPSFAGPLVEIAAMHHAHRDGRLFAT